jgi:uroporphyrinogen decarboxylase
MKPKERMAALFAGQKPDRVPFVPTIYEHAAALLGKTPSQVARSEDLLVRGQLKAYELYGHDFVVVGLDVYNVEAEALGCPIVYYESVDIPGVAVHILGDEPERLSGLCVPDPARDGRMPLLISAACSVNQKIGNEVGVAASIVGPFTLAAMLRGFEKLCLDMLRNPDYAWELLRFTFRVTGEFGAALGKQGIGAAVNESWIAQPLLSPRLYREFVFPLHRELVADLKGKGLPTVSIISGGDTTSIAEMLVETGSSLLMADYNSDLGCYKKKAAAGGAVVRGSMDSKLLELGIQEKIREAALDVLRRGAPGGRFIMGCGVVSYHTKPEMLQFLKSLVEVFTDF